MNTEELREQLRISEHKDKIEKNKETERLCLEKLNSLTNKCFIRSCQDSQKLMYKILGIKHKVISQNGGTLLEVVLNLDRIVNIQIAKKNFNRGSTISHHFQPTQYNTLEQEKFKLFYDKEDGAFNFSKTISNFTMYMQEITEEQYIEFKNVCMENEKISEDLIRKFNIKH